MARISLPQGQRRNPHRLGFIEGDIFRTHIPLKPVGDTTRKTVEETAEIILRLIRSHPSVTAKEMEKATGLTQRGVEYNLNKLKQNGKIKRAGSTKSGYWEITGQ